MSQQNQMSQEESWEERWQTLDFRVRRAVRDYHRYPAAPAIVAALRSIRREVADLWLSGRDRPLESLWIPVARSVQQRLLGSGLRYEGLTPAEQAWLDPLVAELRRGFDRPGAWALLLALLPYQRADQLALPYVGARPPACFLEFFIQTCVDFPCFFRELGEVDRYGNFLIDFVDYVHERLHREPNDPLWPEAARFLINHSNFVALYFTERNLRSPFAKRGALLEAVLRQSGHDLDYAFGPRSTEQTKLRFGILKASFVPHPETFTTFPVFEHLDRDRFEIILYLTEDQQDLLPAYAERRPGDRVVMLTGSAKEQVAQIRADDLDLLLVGTIVTNAIQRILLLAAHRLARVQIHSVSSPVTSGLRQIDYYLSGTYTESDESPQHYTEKLLMTIGSGHRFDYSLEQVETQVKLQRSDLNLPDHLPTNAVIFTSGANLYKVIPEQRQTWARLLAAVPDAVLMLYPFGASWRDGYPKVPFWQSFRETLAAAGVAPDRLILLNHLPSRADVKVVLQIADIYLDSYPFTGANSMVDALEAGLPAVSRQGPWFRSRQGAALMREVGLEDWIAHSEADYLAKASCLARQPELRAAIRDQLYRAMAAGPAFLDSPRYAAELAPLLEGAIAAWSP